MNPAQSQTPGMSGNSMRENRETPQVSGSGTPDRLEKAMSYETSMYAGGESDEQAVPAKRPNKGEQSPAEGVEEAVRPGGTLTRPARAGHWVGNTCHGDSPVCGRQPAGIKPDGRFDATHPRQEPYALKCARTDLCGGRSVTDVPTATKRRWVG